MLILLLVITKARNLMFVLVLYRCPEIYYFITFFILLPSLIKSHLFFVQILRNIILNV